MSDSPQTDISVLDHVTPKPQLAFAQLMPRVVAEYGKSLSSQLKDIVTYCVRGNKMLVDEYYQYRLFDDGTYKAEDKKRFIGAQKAWKILDVLMEPNPFLGLIDDKLAFEKFNNAFGIESTKTIGLVGGHYPDRCDVAKIDSEDSLASFFASAKLPIFGKPVDSLQSLGSALFAKYNSAKRMLTLANGTEVSVGQLFAEINSKFDGNYLFQECLAAHKVVDEICEGGLPTVRIVTLDSGNGPELFRAVIKLTTKGNVADNFWRAGNLLSAIDPETGTMGKALTEMGIDGTFVENHPVTCKPIEGVNVPHWKQVRVMALDAARLLPKSVILGFDIALTTNGPVLIEANGNPHLMMMQVAHRRGVLDEHLQAALSFVENKKKTDAANAKAELAKERAEIRQDIKKATSSKAA